MSERRRGKVVRSDLAVTTEFIAVDDDRTSEKKSKGHNRRRRRVARSAVGVLAVAAGLAAISLVPARSTKRSGSNPGIALSKNNQGPSIGPSYTPPVNYEGDYCDVETKTIEGGQTIFGVTTAGLRSNAYFMNGVYSFTMQFVGQQAKKNPELKDPNDLQPGTKVQIYDDCVQFSPVYKVYEPQELPNGSFKNVPQYVRFLVFQSYEGTDGKEHGVVNVDYNTTSTGKLLSVEACQPEPACYDYVVGAPKNLYQNG